MSPMDKAHKAYENDPAYHALVRTIEAAIENMQLSPHEVREAAMYAVYRSEVRRWPWRRASFADPIEEGIRCSQRGKE